MRHFSFRPALTFQGQEVSRACEGSRASRCTHGSLMSPIGAYMIAAAFDVISFIGDHTAWQREFYQAATFYLYRRRPGIARCDRHRSMGPLALVRGGDPGSTYDQNSHAILMVAMTVVVLVDLGLRWFRYHGLAGPTAALLSLSLAAAVIAAVGATYARVRLRLQRRDRRRPSRLAPL